MTNKELKQKVLDQIDDLGISPRQYSRLNKTDKLHVFPVCPLYIYNLARGKFDHVGKHGLRIMRDYFRQLDLNEALENSTEKYDQVYSNLKNK